MLIILASTIAVAVACVVSFSFVSDASSSDEGPAEGCPDVYPEEGSAGPALFMGPAAQSSQTAPAGPGSLGCAGPSAPSQSTGLSFSGPGAEADEGRQRNGPSPGREQFPPVGGPMSPMDGMTPPDGFGPGHADRVVVVVKNDSSSIEGVIEEYERAYQEKQESNAEVVVVDDNEYTAEEAEIVDAMKEVLRSPATDADFLTSVMGVLESEDKLSAADVVKEVLDKRHSGMRPHKEVAPDQKSKDDDEEEDDMNSDPVYVEESDEEGIPEVFDVPDLMTEDLSFAGSGADFCFGSDNRCCCGVI